MYHGGKGFYILPFSASHISHSSDLVTRRTHSHWFEATKNNAQPRVHIS